MPNRTLRRGGSVRQKKKGRENPFNAYDAALETATKGLRRRHQEDLLEQLANVGI